MEARDKITNLIRGYKEANNTDNLIKILNCFQPLIDKYSRKLGKNEFDDAQQEFRLAILESLQKMKNYDNEGQCINFLKNAVRNRFFELVRKEQNKKDREILEGELLDNQRLQVSYSYQEIEFLADLNKLIEFQSALQISIAGFVLSETMTDQEIAQKLHISRQYVNRCKKDIFHKLKEYVSNC